MESIRCLKCNKLLFKANQAEIEIKCPRCGDIAKIMVIKNPENQKAKEPPLKQGVTYEYNQTA